MFLGKFIGVTVQSGCSAAPWAVQYSPKKHAEDLALKLGCPIVPTTDMVDCIRTFSPKVIMKVRKCKVLLTAYRMKMNRQSYLTSVSALFPLNLIHYEMCKTYWDLGLVLEQNEIKGLMNDPLFAISGLI